MTAFWGYVALGAGAYKLIDAERPVDIAAGVALVGVGALLLWIGGAW